MRFLQCLFVMGLIGFQGFLAQAKDVYNFHVTGNFIAAECQNAAQGNRLQLAMPEAEKGVRTASAKLEVCPVMGAPVSKTFYLPLPMSVLTSNDDIAPGQSRRYRIDASALEGLEEGATPPDVLQVLRLLDRQTRALELSYVDQRTGEIKLGPIRVYMPHDTSTISAKGFNEEQHLPIHRVEIDYKSTTLKAQLKNVK